MANTRERERRAPYAIKWPTHGPSLPPQFPHIIYIYFTNQIHKYRRRPLLRRPPSTVLFHGSPPHEESVDDPGTAAVADPDRHRIALGGQRDLQGIPRDEVDSTPATLAAGISLRLRRQSLARAPRLPIARVSRRRRGGADAPFGRRVRRLSDR